MNFFLFQFQIDNAARVVEKGLGVQLFKHSLTEEKIYNAIQQVINNKRSMMLKFQLWKLFWIQIVILKQYGWQCLFGLLIIETTV